MTVIREPLIKQLLCAKTFKHGTSNPHSSPSGEALPSPFYRSRSWSSEKSRWSQSWLRTGFEPSPVLFRGQLCRASSSLKPQLAFPSPRVHLRALVCSSLDLPLPVTSSPSVSAFSLCPKHSSSCLLSLSLCFSPPQRLPSSSTGIEMYFRLLF